MKKFIAGLSVIIIVFLDLVQPDASLRESKDQVAWLVCGTRVQHNNRISIPNFVATIASISGQMQALGFGVIAAGSGPDSIYGLAQCYGDHSSHDSEDCLLCFAEARIKLPRCLPFGGKIFLDGCFMRAESYSFFQEYTGPNDTAVCGNRTLKNSAFHVSTKLAIEQAVAAAPDNYGYAKAQVPVSGAKNESAYVIATCWRTLTASPCRACLENASASILRCLPSSEGRALNTGCYVRYSDTDFLNRLQGNGSSRGRIIHIGAAISSIVVLVIGAVIGGYIWNRRTQKKRPGPRDAEKEVQPLYDSCLNFKYSTLEKATGSFDEINKLGQGGFGTVYKGVLQDGREIAVKRLFFNNKHRAADFYNEVNIISSVEHKNLVTLLGCSLSGPESLLVYEFLPNKSLDFFIFDATKGKILNWRKRLEIIIGTAEGLVYLHENTKTRIVHRDIKASNILLDSEFHAKIADFGLARSFQEDKSHISTAIAGTLGYMAPEYLARGQLTEKADVYSFGVLLIEIVTGRQNNRSNASEYSESSLTKAWKHFQQRTLDEMLDPNLNLHNYHNNDVKIEILKVVHVALLCTQENPSLRPTMSKALEMLVKQEEHLPTPTNPPYIYGTLELNDIYKDPYSPFDRGNPASVATTSQSILHPR